MAERLRKLRSSALAVLILAGCGDDEGGDEPGDDAGGDAGAPDAAIDDGGEPPIDGSADDGGLLDAGDGHVPMDATTIVDTGTPTDGGGGELAEALKTEGVNADNRRSELLIPVFCAVAVPCAPEQLGGSVEACMSMLTSNWAETVSSGDLSQACLDASLDRTACIAAQPSCEAASANCVGFSELEDELCLVPDAGT